MSVIRRWSRVVDLWSMIVASPGPEVIKLEYSLRLKITRNDWLLADTCLQAANHCALFESENELFILTCFLKSFILGPEFVICTERNYERKIFRSII